MNRHAVRFLLGALLGTALGAAIMMVQGCATNPERESAMAAYDRAAAAGLAPERIERPNARLLDWSVPRGMWIRGVEVAR
jgi:hypothetical protein